MFWVLMKLSLKHRLLMLLLMNEFSTSFKMMSKPSQIFRCQLAHTAIIDLNSFMLKQQIKASAFAGKNVMMPISESLHLDLRTNF